MWVHFYLDGKELAAYTVKGTFAGELDATRELLAAENGVLTDQIVVKIGKKKIRTEK